MGLIDRIAGPEDLKALPGPRLPELAEEIRAFLVENVSKTGGHLGPNLGVVELTIALHRVFDSPSDAILFDTGHQSYVHKILTGRHDFSALRREGGLSGYPSRAESAHDVVENSHATTALSWADGIARGFQLSGQTGRRAVAVVGDGAMTGGMAWEALNNIAEDSDRPLVVVINDNDRSYAPTVGGLVRKFDPVRRLDSIRLSKSYEAFLDWTKRTLRDAGPPGRMAYGALHSIKKGVKDIFVDAGIFDSLGLKYIGPIDGHNLDDLIEALTLARDYGGPVVVHAITEKGRGYEPAERDVHDRFHAIGAIHPETGLPIAPERFGWTSVFAREIARIARADPTVVGITAAMTRPVGLGRFADEFPDRVIDVGIAEQHAMTMAAGLARAGMRPVLALYSTFMNRGFDQLIMDVALHREPVTVVLDRAGITGDDGASHNGVWDLSIAAMVPGLRTAAPRDGEELAALGAEAAGHETTPPPRYTEASLVKALEEREIGRPSTYASIMSTIADRGYVDHRGQALVPTWLAFAVTRLLEENFAELVDYDFTASMEADLDRIAAGREDRVAWLTRFYFGQGAQEPAGGGDGATRTERTEAEQGLRSLVENLGEIDARAVNSIEIGEGITLRVGRYGPYLEDSEGKRANVPADVAPDELTVAKARELFERAADDGRELGVDPATGHMIIAKDGRYGPYVTEVLPEPEEDSGTAKADNADKSGEPSGRTTRARRTTKSARSAKTAGPKPRTASLLRSMDLSTVTLEQALDLLSLPRVVGQDPEGVDITAQNGRYGPYLKKGTDSRSLETEEQIFTVTLEQALELFAQPKRRRGQAAARGPLRELGTDPESGRPVVIKDGRFGPYFTDGEVNVTLRRGDDPATVTPERAYELLAEKRAKGPVKKRTTRRKTTKTAQKSSKSARASTTSRRKSTASRADKSSSS